MKNIKDINLMVKRENVNGELVDSRKSFVEIVGEQADKLYKVTVSYKGETVSGDILTHYYINEKKADQCLNEYSSRSNSNLLVSKEIATKDNTFNWNIPCSHAWDKEGNEILTDRYLNKNILNDWDINNISYFEHN